MEDRIQCEATTKRGTQCRNKAVNDGQYCRVHHVQHDWDARKVNLQNELQALVGELNSFTSNLEKNMTPWQSRINMRPPKDVWHTVRAKIDETAVGELFDQDTWEGVSEYVKLAVEERTEEIAERFRRH